MNKGRDIEEETRLQGWLKLHVGENLLSLVFEDKESSCLKQEKSQDE